MHVAHPHFDLRRVTLLVLCLGAGIAAVVGLSPSATAITQVVVLSGTPDADELLVAVDPDDDSRLLLCGQACFSRSRAEIGTIVIDGLAGDDTLTVHHDENSLATNTTGDLAISFAAGTGLDQVEICTTPPDAAPPADPFTPLPACRADITTVVGPGATDDERVLTQSAAGTSVAITMNDVADVTDFSGGPATVVATEIANQVTYRAAAGSTAVGEVAVDLRAPYRFDRKTSLTLDTGAGADAVEMTTRTGLVTDTVPCAGSAPVCVRGGSGADSLSTTGLPTDAERVAMAVTGGGARLTGLAGTPSVDLADVDRVALALQSSADALSVTTTSGADSVRTASTPNGIVLTGDLDTGGAAFPLQEIAVAGDGTAPLDLTLDTGAGTDSVHATTTAADDSVRLGPTDTDPANHVRDTPCVAAFTACLEVSPGAAAAYRLTLDDVQTQVVEAGPGDDRLDALGVLAADTTWRGGEGTDRVDVRGTGARMSVDLAAASVTQDGSAPVTATATETLGVHAAGGSVRTSGSADDDELTYHADGSMTGRLVRAADPMMLELVEVGGSNVLDPGTGNDTVAIEGAATGDRFAVDRGTDLSVQVDALLPLRVVGSEAAVLRGLGGDDRLDVTGVAGPSTLTVDGGTDAGADRLTFAAAAVDSEVSVDDDLGTGQLSAGGPPVGLLGIERVDVEGDGAHTLAVRGSDQADTLVQSGNTVTVGRTTDVAFSRFPRVTLDGGVAADRLSLAPATTVGVADLTAQGGGGADSLSVRGTALGERITYTPTTADAGMLALTGAPPTAFAGIEDTELDGATAPPSGDLLVVRTPHHDGTLVHDSGSTFDAGTVRFLDVTGTSSSATPLHYARLGRGEVEFAAEAGAPADRVVLAGQPDDDIVQVSTRSTAGGDVAVVALDHQLLVAVPGARTLVLDGREGPDTFRVPSDHAVPGQSGPGIEVRGGGPDVGDRLQVTGGGGDQLVDLAGATVGESGHAALHQTGVERIDLTAASAAVRVIGGSGPDAFAWQPTGPTSGEVTAPGSPVLGLGGLGLLTLDTMEGADRISVALRHTDDTATVERGATTEVAATGLQAVQVPAATVESLALATGDGADRIRVVGSGGPSTLAVDGGAPASGGDVLRLEAADASVSYATDPTAGQLGSSGGAVDFTGLERIESQGTGNGALEVNGTGGAETLTIGEEATPMIGVDEAAAITYAGYPDLTLDGHAGDDDITVGYGALGDVTTLRVTGGAGAGDRVTVADTPGTTRTLTVRPQTATGGLVTATGIATAVVVAESERVALDGRGGDDTVRTVTPTGAQQVTVDPGSVADAAGVRVGSLLPLELSQVGTAGALAIADESGERVDEVVLRGSTASDAFTVDGGTGTVRRVGWIPVLPQSARDMALLGGEGDDAATMSGPLPFRTTTMDGAGPDLGDRLSVQGPTGAVEVNLAAATVTGYGGVVSFPGVADLHTDVGGQALTQVGTARDDALCYDPMAPRDGRLYIVGAPGGGTASSICLPDQRGANVLHTFVDVGHLTADPAAGADEVIVNGTTSRDLISIHARAPLTHVTVHPEPESGSTYRLPVHVVVATTESLVTAADNGSDSVDVSAYDSAAPLISVFGEGPSTMHVADSLVFRDATGAASMRDRNSHTKGAGTLTATYTKGSGAVIRTDYDGMEEVTIVRDPKTG